MTPEAIIKELGDDLLRISDAAAYLGVTPKTLRNWDQSGKLLPLRHPVTGYRYYRTKDLSEFLRSAENQRRGKPH